MKRFSIAVIFLTTAFAAEPAQAALNRVWVSSKGVDGLSCGSAVSPCRQIKYALDNGLVSPGGEIVVYDSSAFSPFSVAQSVSVINDGAGTTTIQQPTAGQNAITISSTTPIKVTLKGLNLDGLGSGGNGVAVTSSLPAGASSGGEVIILDCLIKNFADSGVSIKPTLSGAGTRPLMVALVSDSTLLGNATNGMIIAPAIDVSYTVSRSTFEGNQTGLRALGNDSRANGWVLDSKFIRNPTTGVSTAATFQAILTLKNSTVLGSTIDVIDNYIVNIYNNNTIGILQTGGSTTSDGSNNIGSGGSNLLPSPQR